MKNLLSLHSLVGFLAVLTGVLLLAAGCGRHPDASPRSEQLIAAQAPAYNDYVGSAACQACHPKEVASQCVSRHARALRAADRQSLGPLAPPASQIPQSVYAVTYEGTHIRIETPEQPDNVAYPQLAFGSGKTGMTYVLVLDSDSQVEIRMSYFPHLHRWYVTPGQQNAPPYALGRGRRGQSARMCLLCHAVALPANSLMPEKRFFGVSCEVCHGPGRAHVAAMRAGDRNDLHMEKIARLGATRINELCGKCHRTQNEINAFHLSKDSTQRFQPFGLMQSECFKQSHDTLSCLRCHDPHTDTSADEKHYVAACLTCHAAQRAPAAASQAVSGKPCPVNPRDKCIGCHMPRRKVFAALDVPTSMPDHFIRVHRETH